MSFSLSDFIPKVEEPVLELLSEDEAEVKAKRIKQIVSEDEEVFEDFGGFDDDEDAVVSDGG